jgi:hypothetical protein
MISHLLDDVAELLSGMSSLSGVNVSAKLIREVSSPDLDELTVAVSPLPWSPQAAGRTRARTEARIGIYVSRRVETDTEARAVLDLAHEIAVELIGTNVTKTDYQWACTGADATPNPDDSLAETNVMKVLIEATLLLV